MTDYPTDANNTSDHAIGQLAAEIKKLRHAAGLSQPQLAQRVGYTRQYVSLAERPGKNIPSHELVSAIDNALSADGSLLTLRALAKTEQQALRSGAAAASTPSFCAEKVITGGFAEGDSGEITGDFPRCVESGMSGVGMLRRTFLLGGVVSGLHVGHASSAPPAVAEELVDQLYMASAAYRSAYSTVPATQLYAAVREHFNLVLSLRPGDQPTKIRQRLLTTAGEMAALAAPVLGLNLGRWDEAGDYLEFAFGAAREVENRDLETIVWACRAFHAAYGMDDPQSGQDFADVAVATGNDGASATTRAWAAAVASERHADLNDEATSLRLLEQARTDLSSSNEDQHWSGIGTFDNAKITAYAGGNYGRLKRHHSAVQVLDEALTNLDESMRRHRCTAFIDRAEAHLACSDVDAACVDTHNALLLAVETQHSDTVSRAKKLAKSALSKGAFAARELWQDVLTAQAATTV